MTAFAPIASMGWVSGRCACQSSLLLATGVLLASLSGCVSWSSVNAEKVALPVPAKSWVQADVDAGIDTDMSKLLDGWLARFEDPTLLALVAEAIESNPGLSAARGRLREGEGGALVAGAPRLPSVDANLQGTRSRSNTAGQPVISERFTGNLSLNWEVDVWGRVAAGANAADADLAALNLDLQAARFSLAAAVARAWFDVIEGARQIDLSEALVTNLGQHLATLESGYRQGIYSAADVSLAQSNFHSEQSRLAERQRVLGDRKRTLEILLGRYPVAAVRGHEQLPNMPGPVPAGLPADLLTRRADVVAAERRAFAAELRQSAAYRDRFPKLSLTASAGGSSSELSDLLNAENRVWSLIANLVQPLIDGGRREGAEVQAAARLTQAQARYVEVVLQAFAEVEGALEQEQRLRTQLLALRAAEAAAIRAETISSEQYRAGIESTLAMLEVKRRRYTAQSSYLDAQLRQLKNRINLYLALGGDYAAAAVENVQADK